MLDDKVCFVSGAARGKGNGRAIALALAEKGAHVAVGDILLEGAQSVADEIRALGRKSLAVKMDMSVYEQVESGFNRIRGRLKSANIGRATHPSTGCRRRYEK